MTEQQQRNYYFVFVQIENGKRCAFPETLSENADLVEYVNELNAKKAYICNTEKDASGLANTLNEYYIQVGKYLYDQQYKA